ncbi:hypothetical protein HYN59_07870 [Flavobacterium album]|uniref:Outer membrane protein beta-barrel domain-containing protein n=1 Tax=Flavobacterium album TaxID=2175091 RepID=A0A2S1QXC4_9FLAO|nr:hypothetical protein [Flavobacterium album]AWH85048.1 hypothetical protein HYN59_07870 [Flavobacterium album]
MKNILVILLSFSTAVTLSQDCEQFIFESGVRVPFGSLAGKIGPSPEFAIWNRSGISDCWAMSDIGISIYIPTDRQQFDYATPDSIYRVKAIGVSGMAGIRVAKDYPVGNQLEMQWLSTLGYAFFVFDDKHARHMHKLHPEDFKDSTNDVYVKGLSTFHIGQGIRFGYPHLGLHINYNYTPYGMFSKHVTKDFGSHSLSFAIVYRT